MGAQDYMPLHYLRAQYAQDLYRYFEGQGAATGQLYHCRKDRAGDVYDKGILMAVSQNLGHSRCDVVVSHYMYEAYHDQQSHSCKS